MPTGLNGVVTRPAVVREPFVVAPATISYPFEINGETVILDGYMKAGCPIDVAIAYDEALVESEAEQPTAAERGSPGDPTADPPVPPTPGTISVQAYYTKLMRAERMLRRALLCAVIPGLAANNDFRAANVLAADDGPYEQILVELGWWTRVTAPADEGVGPEAGGEAVTSGDAASPDSSPVTASTPSGLG